MASWLSDPRVHCVLFMEGDQTDPEKMAHYMSESAGFPPQAVWGQMPLDDPRFLEAVHATAYHMSKAGHETEVLDERTGKVDTVLPGGRGRGTMYVRVMILGGLRFDEAAST
jgi:hypothetical protein